LLLTINVNWYLTYFGHSRFSVRLTGVDIHGFAPDLPLSPFFHLLFLKQKGVFQKTNFLITIQEMKKVVDIKIPMGLTMTFPSILF